MKKTVVMLAVLGLVCTTSFGGTPIGRDLGVAITQVTVSEDPIITQPKPYKWRAVASATVRNYGTLATPLCYLKITASSGIDTYLAVPAMQPGQSASFVYGATLVKGSYTASAMVDCYGQIAEVNEANNSSSMRYSVP